METLIKITQFFLSLTLLVGVHELGHFLMAKLFRVRVDKFYLFFDFGFSLWKRKWGETEYGIGWCPLGGYCKMAGMIDESLDRQFQSHEPQAHEFRAKRPWQRFLILVAGVTMNVVAAFVIYSGIAYSCGTAYLDNASNEYGYDFGNQAQGLGFRNGDRIRTIDGVRVENYSEIFSKVILADSDVAVGITRDGRDSTLELGYSKINAVRKSGQMDDFVIPRMPFVIDSIVSSGACEAGLMVGDRVCGVNGEREFNFFRFGEMLGRHSSSTVQLDVERDTAMLAISVPVDAEGHIGVVPRMLLPYCQREYSFLESFPEGARATCDVIEGYWNQLRLIVKPETGLYKQIGGFIAIGNVFPSSWDWLRFWEMTAFISIVLAIMNLIPIPGLDGGHIIFTLWEMITGRKVSDRVLLAAQYIGLMLLLFLLLYANGSDVARLLR